MDNTTSISVRFSEADGITEKFWGRITVEPFKSNFVALSEAAEVLDSIYDVNPCSDDSALLGGFPTIAIEEEDIPGKLNEAFGLIQYNPCKYDTPEYSYEASVFIYRSHNTFPYKLVVNAGTVLRTEKIERQINLVVLPEDKKIDTEFFIAGNIICDYEVESFTGSQVKLKKNVTKNISFSFKTVYDKVTIKVNGTSTESLDAECIVFYKELAYNTTITKPKEDLEAINLLGCSSYPVNGEETEDDDEVYNTDCYQWVTYSQYCTCSDMFKTQVVVKESAPCPWLSKDLRPWDIGPKYVQTRTWCPEDGGWEGQEQEFYLDNCCVTKPYGLKLPLCEKQTTDWIGGAGIVKGADFYYGNAFHDEQIVLVPVGPEDGICGTIEYIQEVNSKNCCDAEFITPIVYDTENSAEVIADNSVGQVYWTGGGGDTEDYNYTVSVRGTGFFLDRQHTKQEIQTNYRQAAIHTDEECCGNCSVRITDGCSEASGNIRSTEGRWVFVISHNVVTDPGSVPMLSGEWDEEIGTFVAYVGEQQFRQRIQLQGHAAPVSGPCGGNCPYDYNAYNWDGRTLACDKGGDGAWNISGRISAPHPSNPGYYEDNCGMTRYPPICRPTNSTSDCYPLCICGIYIYFKIYTTVVNVYEWRC